ncbi:MAG: transposase [Actinomycetota bacterium]
MAADQYGNKELVAAQDSYRESKIAWVEILKRRGLKMGIQFKAKAMIHDMYMAPSKEDALVAYDHFVSCFYGKYPRAVECLTKDNVDLFNFYDFPFTRWR